MLSQKKIREIFILAEYFSDHDDILNENQISIPKEEIKFSRKENKFVIINKRCELCGITRSEGLLFRLDNKCRCIKHLRIKK